MLGIISKAFSIVGAMLTGASLFFPWIEITNSNFIHKALDALSVLVVIEAPYVAAVYQGS